MVYQLLCLAFKMLASDWRSTGSLAVSQLRHFYVSILAPYWRKFRMVEPKPVKMTSQTHKYLIVEDYIKYKAF